MKKEKSKLWFRAKIYGWGWYPCSWEGWLVMLFWVVLFIFLLNKVEQHLVLTFILIFISFVVLLIICWKKGEKPGWRWGIKK
jgi:uncharacterized membrane protein YhaH (DUF805 family)